MGEAFLLIACEQSRYGFALQNHLELPTEIMSIAQPTIHALTTEWWHQMGGISQQKNSVSGKMLCQGGMESVDRLADDLWPWPFPLGQVWRDQMFLASGLEG